MFKRLFLGRVKRKLAEALHRFLHLVCRARPSKTAQAARLVVLAESEAKLRAVNQHFADAARRYLEVLAVEAVFE